MNNTSMPASAFSPTFGARIEAATVEEILGPQNARVAGGTFGGSARVAVAGYRPQRGDRVLVTQSGEGELYILGVLRALRAPPAESSAEPAPTAVRAPDGSEASLQASEEGEALVVRDAGGKLLFEYFPEQGRSVVHVADGDLELRADAGRIDLNASEGVHIRSAGPVELRSDQAVRLAAAREDHDVVLDVLPDAVTIAAPSLRMRAGQAKLSAGDLSLEGKDLHIDAERLEQRIGILTTTATRIIEKAQQTFREIEGLAQTRAGRVRYVAEKAFHVLGERTLFKARKEMKIKGEKIYLS